MSRRSLLFHLLGLGTACAGVSLAGVMPTGSVRAAPTARKHPGELPFKPLRGPIPLTTDGLSAPEQRRAYARVTLRDQLLVAEGYHAEVLMRWGDPLGSGRFGFNNDYLAFTPLDGRRALLTVNFEYISPRPWVAGYREVMGRELPFQELRKLLAERGGRVDALTLAVDDPLRRPLMEVATAAMEDVGIGVVEIVRTADQSWSRRRGRYDRRISGLTGLESAEARLRCSGPAAAVFRRLQKLGHDDGLGDRIIGSFANCAGGQTPWGTVLSAEENFQSHVVEAVYADGSSPPPAERPFRFDGDRLEGLGNPFGMVGNKYGWMVEIDPRRPELPLVKHTALGRFRHEAVAVRARAGEPLVVYSGCDRHGGHLYRFVSAAIVRDPRDPANSRLLERGRLEVARFEADGGGRWIPLEPRTPINPLPPSHFSRFNRPATLLMPHSDRNKAGAEPLESDDQLNAYRKRFGTLADLYTGRGEEQLGAILIDAHLAANAAGATPTARPEDTELDPRTGDLLITFTAAGSDGEGQADPAIFRGPAGEHGWPYGWVMRLEDGPAISKQPGGAFRWRMVATGGTPWQGGMGFANPDNLAIDSGGNVWMVTDRAAVNGSADVFGNNACWIFPATGAEGEEPLLFATGPMECELTGPCFDSGESTLFLSVQHPGEDNATHHGGDEEVQAYTLRDRNGGGFEQLRQVPLGSNWPAAASGTPPRPAVVAIRRLDGGPLLGGSARPHHQSLVAPGAPD
ncbi:MAG: PhoX family protein [Cyanobacteriota bacterium]|jgi:secreted PhoX family phosphatase